VVAYGLRNPWRFSFDQQAGAVYVGDVGYDSYEEVDYAVRLSGRPLNFGWSYYEGEARQEHGATSLNSVGRLVRPLYVYDHTQRNCSITGGYVYRGNAAPALRGRYVFGDWCSGRIWSLRVVGGRATDVRLEPATVKLIVSFCIGPDGELYALALNGGVYRLTGS
jgi:glucose/arabinose dehydrogenase